MALEIAFEFRLAKARHPEDHTSHFWMMEMVGKVETVGHAKRSLPLASYPSKREMAQFVTRSSRALRDWFDGPEYAAAKSRAEEKSRPKLLVIPGRG